MIGLVISGIVAAIFLVGYVDELLYWRGQRMQLEELLQVDCFYHLNISMLNITDFHILNEVNFNVNVMLQELQKFQV